MQNSRNNPHRTNRTVLAALTATAMFGATAIGQGPVTASPYGEPSECQPGGSGTLGLYLIAGRTPALRLEGGAPGEPAVVAFANEARTTQLSGGGTLLIGPMVGHAMGRFDADGVFVRSLDTALFAARDGALFAQGMQPMTTLGRGTELSAGLHLSHKTAPPPTEEGNAASPPENILVEEVAGLMRTGALEAALDVALNSKGDALTLDINANLEVPIVVVPGVTVGGKAAFKAKIKRDEDTVGAVVYDLAIGADVAASAGVGVNSGAAGAGLGGSSGKGVEIVWRFASTHELARALRSMTILQAVADQIEVACMAIDAQLERVDRAVDAARRAADRVRGAVRSVMPWADNALVRQMQHRHDELRAQRREIADRIRKNVESLISWIAEARIFLIKHQHGYEVRQTMAIEANASVGIPVDGGTASGSNLGASVAAGIEQQNVLRAEFVPESEAVLFERKFTFTKSLSASAGFGVGMAGSNKRVIELSTKLQMGKDGLQPDASGTTVKVTLDNRVLLALGSIISSQAGIGREVTLELRLADLLGYSKDAIAILLGDDEHKVAEMLLAFPLEFSVRGRYEAGFACGIGLDLEGLFKGGIGASAMLTDCGIGFEYEGGSGTSLDRGETVPNMVFEALRGALLQRERDSVGSRLDAIGAEVARVMQR